MAELADLVGTYDMNHDGWHGTLVINPSDQIIQGIDGACVFRSWVISGTYTGGDGVARTVQGTFQGKDTNRRTGEACPQSDNLVSFTIDFGDQQQPFAGYIFSWQKSLIAGYTWWDGIPFGWFASKK